MLKIYEEYRNWRFKKVKGRMEKVERRWKKDDDRSS